MTDIRDKLFEGVILFHDFFQTRVESICNNHDFVVWASLKQEWRKVTFKINIWWIIFYFFEIFQRSFHDKFSDKIIQNHKKSNQKNTDFYDKNLWLHIRSRVKKDLYFTDFFIFLRINNIGFILKTIEPFFLQWFDIFFCFTGERTRANWFSSIWENEHVFL